MNHQQDEGDDKKSMALINSLLNDLQPAAGTWKPANISRIRTIFPILTRKFPVSGKRMPNLDIQDELTRTKTLPMTRAGFLRSEADYHDERNSADRRHCAVRCITGMV